MDVYREVEFEAVMWYNTFSAGLWPVPFTLSNKIKMHSLFFFLCAREDELTTEQEIFEKTKQSLESNENSVEVSGLIHVN